MKNLKQQIYKNQRLIICFFIVFLILLVDYNLFFKSAIRDLIKLSPQVRELNIRYASANNAIANMAGYKNRIEELRSRLSLYKKKFSTKQQESALLEELSETAKSSGVKITAIKPYTATIPSQQGVPAGAYQKFPISMQATCGYHELGTFLNKLENADTFMRVADIRITSDPKDPEEHLVYVVVNTYVLLTEGS